MTENQNLNYKTKGIFNFYENPLDISILVRFENAVRILSTTNGSLNERLYKAYFYSGLFHLQSDAFQDIFIREKLKYVEEMIDKDMEWTVKLRLKLPSDYHIERQQFSFHWKETSKLSDAIFSIYVYLVHLKILNEKA